MTKDEALAFDLALEALEVNNQAWKSLADSGDAGFWEAEEQPFYELSVKAITAIKQARALDKMAENARELGLDYEPVAYPEGWRLVPLEPTQKMIDAVPTKPHPTRPNGWGDRNAAIYQTMVLAATAPPAQPTPLQEPPPECRTEAEKRAYAFGWWKALEANRAAPVQEPSRTQTKQIVDGLQRCHHPDSQHEFLRTWVRDWTIHKTAQRPFVGLTDEEIMSVAYRAGFEIHEDYDTPDADPNELHWWSPDYERCDDALFKLRDLIEAKLKEKNT
jgi:hypothetical protein